MVTLYIIDEQNEPTKDICTSDEQHTHRSSPPLSMKPLTPNESALLQKDALLAIDRFASIAASVIPWS